MNYDKYIKALLLKVNQQGKEINYETITSYSRKYNTMLTTCVLKIWHSKNIIVNEDTGAEKTIYWCDTKEFSGARKYATLIKYLLKVGGENGKE